ncbi:MAG TPA: ABC-F family ATP-binding cassette domain-containing protein [Pseudonocardiaceae bacterium]
MSDASVVCSALSFSWPDSTPVFRDLSFAAGPGRTGLVAPNGAGKSTLLRLITGSLTPSAGSIRADGVVGYLPQTLPFTDDLTVAEVLGVAPVLAALAAIESGDASERHFTTVGQSWDAEQRCRASLDRLGLGDLAMDRPLGTLSGGEVMSLGLAAQLLRRPDVLLLDEPTNNLDRDARERLYAVLDDWTGCLVVAAHDRELLDRMDRIAELERGELRWYGGNFTAYEEAVTAEREVTERAVRGAELELRREKRERQQARERAARRAGVGARKAAEGGIPRIVVGTLKRRAEESAGRADEVHAARVSAARTRLDDAESALRDGRRIVVALPRTVVPAGTTVFSGSGLSAGPLFTDVSLVVRGPERIALTGPNGSGKSTLLRRVHALTPRSAYLSQRLDLLDDSRSVLDNLVTFAPDLSVTERMHLLARFLFTGKAVHLPIGALSGGERLRATLACVLFASPPPRLLLLDEPTNNLDLVSVAQLVSALAAYRGAFIVVSHDERFLGDLAPTRHLHLADGTLTDVPL